MQLLFIKEFDILQFVFVTLGILIVFIADLESTKKDYKKKND